MIELIKDQLTFSFPEVHEKARCTIEFQRTLRIPDDNREYYLPPGLGRFPLAHVDDFGGRVPASWVEHGGVFLPMYQTEAMWMNFDAVYPFAVKIAAGKINAVTGDGWTNDLSDDPQDYVAIPGQPWLDGFCVSVGTIRQFVAMPLGEGYTAEEQLTGDAEHGGVQLVVYPMKADVYERIQERKRKAEPSKALFACMALEDTDMGLAPGGLMRQEIYDDPYGLDAWETQARSRCYVHIANSLAYTTITGRRPPQQPPTAKNYTAAGLPWFDYYDDELKALKGAEKLARLDSVAAKKIKKNDGPLRDNDPVSPGALVKLGKQKHTVREGSF